MAPWEDPDLVALIRHWIENRGPVEPIADLIMERRYQVVEISGWIMKRVVPVKIGMNRIAEEIKTARELEELENLVAKVVGRLGNDDLLVPF